MPMKDGVRLAATLQILAAAKAACSLCSACPRLRDIPSHFIGSRERKRIGNGEYLSVILGRFGHSEPAIYAIRKFRRIGEPASVPEQFFQAIRVKLFNQLDILGAKLYRCFLCVRHVEIDYAM
jgi:hypothetical protein